MERFVLDAADLHGFETAERAGKRTWYVEFGADALVEHLPGVPGGARWLGTFDRDEAVRKEDLDFFASGHALVEGLFRELEDGARGRVGPPPAREGGRLGGGPPLRLSPRHGRRGGRGRVRRHAAPRVGGADPRAPRPMRAASVPRTGWRSSGRPRAAARPTGPRSSAVCRAAILAERKGRRLEAVAAFRLMR